MEPYQRAQSSRRMLSAVLRADSHLFLLRPRTALCVQLSRASRTAARRNASSSTNIPGSKAIELEQPDKFRPPSHPQRLPSGRPPPRAAYNQGPTPAEREVQKTKRYPHTFPNEGTGMHWFLTNRKIHMYITLGTLSLLALFSLAQTFIHTSPYAHLLPPLSSLPFHPLTFFSESLSVFRLHMEYTTSQTAESRKQNILDAQKRRLYRRAHGIEDPDAEEDQGVDVRGLVPWDDGLTKKEREQGGRRVVPTGRMVVEMGGEVGEDIGEFMRRRTEEKRLEKEVEERERAAAAAEEDNIREMEKQRQQRKRKLWFGIW